MSESYTNGLGCIAFIGGYLPRQCGIATFTTDLTEAMVRQFDDITFFAVPVNDRPEGYDYPPRVRFELAQQELASYRRGADYLNINGVDLVCLQHEFGIFGGSAGAHVISLLRDLNMPVVTTFHTVLRNPDPPYLRVMRELIDVSDRMVVMSRRAEEFLRDIYHVPADCIDFIPHGIPDVPFVDPNYHKDQFGVEGKTVLLTFGLLSRNKGIEYAIQAMPEIVSRFPDTVYIVQGATHPYVLREEGESYRHSLEEMVRRLGVQDHVIFMNRFISLEELVELIGAADIYLTPYLSPEQVVSGTLAYTVGAGKAVISTPYWYAQELLADGRGVIVPFRDSRAIADEVINLLTNETERHAMRKQAYLLGREMIWSEVAKRYMESFGRAREQKRGMLRSVHPAVRPVRHQDLIPDLNLTYLKRMTDDTGLLQHAVFTVPDYREGYSIDDNARALIAAILIEETYPELTQEANDLASRYMSFLWYAFNPEDGRFRNFLSYDRRWLEDFGSEDSHGRSLWALGTVLGRSAHAGLRGVAARLFADALPVTTSFQNVRAWAFTLIGIHEYLRSFFGDRSAQDVRELLAERLLDAYQHHSTPDWPWFEEMLSYSNARLPQALLLSGRWLHRPDMIEAALVSLRWLADLQRSEDDLFIPIGSDGFYPKGSERAFFDQQPVEANAMVSACLEAYRVTGDSYWYDEAQRAFYWFLGRNHLGIIVCDPRTGGCRDGLHPDRVNENQGAESTLSYLLSLVEMRSAETADEALFAEVTPNGHR
ncbi:MAG: glycosyltransferase [Anaerolineae bacterium]|jgi:glycosyltransferase involved in cell wall biosynthesis